MKQFWAFSLLVAILLVACSAETEPTAVVEPSTRNNAELPQENPIDLPADNEANVGGESVTMIAQQAPIESIELMMLESFPLQIHVQINGNLPDGCTSLGPINQSRSGNIIFVRLPINDGNTGLACTQALVPFEEVVSLDVENLTAGTYTVDVNGVIDTFTLDMDNAPIQDPFEQCNFADPSQPSYANLEMGYCLQHPLGFIAEEAVSELVIIHEMEPTEAGISLAIEAKSNDGRSTEQLAEDTLRSWANGTEGVTQEETTIDGETLIIADGIPGTVNVRMGFIVHDETAYTFTLYPSDPDVAEATEKADALWQAVLDSFDFTK